MSAIPAEDPYGLRKRFEFVRQVIEERRPASVVEVGCGSGAYLLEPLARAFPAVRFAGVDPDLASIDHARSRIPPANLTYSVGTDPLGAADLLIASEVIEHVEQPARFLAGLRASLNDGGAIVLTTPNGYGPFEWASLVQAVLTASGVLALLTTLWRRLRGRGAATEPVRDSYAISPHINFFSWQDIRGVIGAAGCRVQRYRGRTLLCGFGFDLLGRWPRLASWNARIGDRLWPALVSDWMFVVVPDREAGGAEYARNGWARMRRRLNERLANCGRR